MNIHIIDTSKDLKNNTKLTQFSLQQLHNTYKPQKLNTLKTHIWNSKTYNKIDKFPIKAITSRTSTTTHPLQSLLDQSLADSTHTQLPTHTNLKTLSKHSTNFLTN
jgi:hypothetical protein